MKCLAFLALAICPALAQAQEFLNDGRVTPDVNMIENVLGVSMASNGQEFLMASFEWNGPGTGPGAAVYSSSSRGGLDLIQ